MFAHSRQRRRLAGSEAELQAARTAAHEAGINAVKVRRANQSTGPESASSSPSLTHSQAVFRDQRLPGLAQLAFLTEGEAAQLLQHYAAELVKLCNSFPTKDEVIWTAAMYFWRYWQLHSILEHHPRSVAQLCMFLACKIEEFNIEPYVLFSRMPNPEADRKFVMHNEIELCDTLDYELVVHGPFRPLRGFLADMAASHPGLSSLSESLYAPTADRLKQWVSSDVLLLHPPSQIALAALMDTAEKMDADIGAYLLQLTRDRPAGADGVSLEDFKQQLRRITIIASAANTTSDQRLAVGHIQTRYQAIVTRAYRG